MKLPAVGAAIAALALCSASWAQTSPIDPRIRSVRYDPNSVISLVGHFDYQTMIEFGPGERIENVSIGDAPSWQVTPNRAATLLFVKPIEDASDTNMTVVTTRRRYIFELTAQPAQTRTQSREMTYVLRFIYPPEPAAPSEVRRPPERRNTAYAYSGSRAAFPALVFDDGASTYFQWPEGGSTPALFVIDEDGRESIANYGYRDGYLVVEQLAPRFRLRNGEQVATITNQGWRAPGADARTAEQARRRRGCHDRRQQRDA